jgi:hypothetical protein
MPSHIERSLHRDEAIEQIFDEQNIFLNLKRKFKKTARAKKHCILF